MLPALSAARGISCLVREDHFLGSLPSSTPDVVQASLQQFVSGTISMILQRDTIYQKARTATANKFQ